MNRKLSAIFSEIRHGKGVIDVGTDHGYIPSALAKAGYKGTIIASDINIGPLETAKRIAARDGVLDKIVFTLSDGLDACPPDAVDTIIIAGMGGDLITNILSRAAWCAHGRYTLLLQPATKPETVRAWLIANGFRIEKERIVEDNSILYPLMTARFGESEEYTSAELFAGKFELLRADPLYGTKLDELIRRINRGIVGISSAEKKDEEKLKQFYATKEDAERLREML